MGEPSTFLGQEFNIKPGKSITIHQNKYLQTLLNRYDKQTVYKYSTPVEPGLKLQKSEYTASKEDIKLYQQQVGALLYLALKTRPDINFAVNHCLRFSSKPGKDHWRALNRIWGYLNNKPNYGLYYNTIK